MRLLFLGHSLVAYYDWQRRFPGHEVHNLGVAGESTVGLLGRAGGIISDHPAPDVVLVMTGTNDVLMGDGTFPENCRRLAGKLTGAYQEARIVLLSVLPVDPGWTAPTVIVEANRKVRDAALGSGAEFLDLTALFAGRDGRPRQGMLLEDGVHLSPEGYRIWSEALEKKLGLQEIPSTR